MSGTPTQQPSAHQFRQNNRDHAIVRTHSISVGAQPSSRKQEVGLEYLHHDLGKLNILVFEQELGHSNVDGLGVQTARFGTQRADDEATSVLEL